MDEAGDAAGAREVLAENFFGQDQGDFLFSPGDGGVDELPTDEWALSFGEDNEHRFVFRTL